jgi:hypothetical protein
MASDRKQFERAQERWQALHEAEAYSVPENLGKTAIIVSLFLGYSSDIESDTKEFTKEADSLVDAERDIGYTAEVLMGATGSDITAILRDPNYANIVTIGHGALPYLYIENGLRNGKPNNRYDWRDVSQNADHLKSGRFVQRHCGNAARNLSVPLGSFAMQQQDSVMAALNSYYQPSQLPESLYEDNSIQLVPSGSPMDYGVVKALFSYDQFQESTLNLQPAED